MLSACSTLSTTGLVSFAIALSSEPDRLLVRTEDLLQRAADLADGRVRLHGVHRGGHDVAPLARGARERLERLGDLAGVALRADLVEASDLLVGLLAAVRVKLHVGLDIVVPE